LNRNLSGDGLFRKTGAATLAVNQYMDFSGELDVTAGHVAFTSKLPFRHIRLTVSAARGTGNNENPLRTSLSKLELFNGGVKVPWPSGTVATGSAFLNQDAPGIQYGPAQLLNSTMTADFRWIAIGLPAWAQFDLLAPTEFDTYTLTTSNETAYHYRDPTAWTFEASRDGIIWETLDAKTGQSYPGNNGYVLGPHPVAFSSGLGGVSGMTLTLRPGASAEFTADTHTFHAIGGIGAVSGDALLTVSGLNLHAATQPGDALEVSAPLTLTAPAEWTAAAAADGIAPLASEADVTFEGGGALTLTGAASLPTGLHPLVTCAAPAVLTGFNPALWTVTADDPKRHYSLTLDGDTVALRIIPKGLLILVK